MFTCKIFKTRVYTLAAAVSRIDSQIIKGSKSGLAECNSLQKLKTDLRGWLKAKEALQENAFIGSYVPESAVIAADKEEVSNILCSGTIVSITQGILKNPYHISVSNSPVLIVKLLLEKEESENDEVPIPVICHLSTPLFDAPLNEEINQLNSIIVKGSCVLVEGHFRSMNIHGIPTAFIEIDADRWSSAFISLPKK